MRGFLLINKPKGVTSFDVVKKVRRSLGIKRVGHSGTLDKLATGLLVIAVGEATKLLEYFIGCEKEYEVVAHLGAISDTYDSEGPIKEVEFDGEVDLQDLEAVVREKFVGEIEQVPPKYSALKIDGKRASSRVRAGEKVEMKSRKVMIKDVEVLNFDWPRVQMKVSCSAGTYIRSLVHDLGHELGCGAYVEELRRTRVGDYKIENAVSEEEDLDQALISIEDFCGGFDKVELEGENWQKLSRGDFIKGELNETTLALFEGNVVGILENAQKSNYIKMKKRIF